MKKQTRILAMLAVAAALAVPFGCKDDDPTPLELSTITVGGADLNGAASPTGVATDATIEINFSTNVDASTANSTNIKLMRDFDDADVPLTITPDGSKVTIKSVNKLSAGNLYVLTIGEGLKSDKGQTLAAESRNFTTAGFFAPPAMAAHWQFEGNGNDVLGAFNASGAGTAVTYVAGRNAASGQAASFNGTTSIMEVPNADQFLNGKDFSLSLWVKIDGTNTHGNFVLGVAGFLGFQVEIPADGSSIKMAAQYDNGDGTSAGEDTWWNGENVTKDNGGWQGWTFARAVGGGPGMTGIFKDKWAHVVFTYNATSRLSTMYVNGEKSKEFDFNLYPATDKRKTAVGVKFNGKAAPGNNLAFGFLQSSSATNRSLSDSWASYDDVNNNHFKGQLDDVRIFKRPLSAAEITLIYNSEK